MQQQQASRQAGRPQDTSLMCTPHTCVLLPPFDTRLTPSLPRLLLRLLHPSYRAALSHRRPLSTSTILSRPPPQLSRRLVEKLLARAWAADPADRPTASEIAAELEMIHDVYLEVRWGARRCLGGHPWREPRVAAPLIKTSPRVH